MRLIDADAVLELFKPFKDMFADEEVMSAYFQTLMLIHNTPSIEVVPKDFHDKTCEAMAKRHTEEIQKLMPKQGKWKHGDMGVGYYEYPCCSKCGYETEEETNFCPNCGADMRGENNETDKEMR